MISLKIISTPAALTRLRESGGSLLIAALTRKMNELMIRLQQKVVGDTIPRFFSAAPNIASSVQFIPSILEGTKIVGGVTAGGPRTTTITKKSGAEVDYAAVQEYGVSHSYEILPIEKRALRFLMDSKPIFAARVLHPPLEARPYMRTALEEFGPDIVAGLNDTFVEVFNAGS